MRELITFECTKCKNRNYVSLKNKKKSTTRLERSKFCPACRVHTGHKEIK